MCCYNSSQKTNNKFLGSDPLDKIKQLDLLGFGWNNSGPNNSLCGIKFDEATHCYLIDTIQVNAVAFVKVKSIQLWLPYEPRVRIMSIVQLYTLTTNHFLSLTPSSINSTLICCVKKHQQ